MSTGSTRSVRIVAGIIAANVAGILACGLFVLVYAFPSNIDALKTLIAFTSIASMFLVPLGMGMVAAYVWRTLGLRILAYLGWSFVTTMVTVGASYLVLREGIVCLLMASPLLFCFIFAGAMLGRVCFKPKISAVNLTLFPFLLLALAADAKLRRDRDVTATDAIVINAEAAAVWPHVVAFPPIKAAPDYWLNYIGLPSASATTCEGEFVGARRRCIFSNGLVFEEKVSELIPQRVLTFEIVDQPRDPELLGHLTLHRGQFELRDNGNGTTTLTGRSWYTLHVRPLWYFEWWARDITRHVHLRVMEQIKQLSEHPA